MPAFVPGVRHFAPPRLHTVSFGDNDKYIQLAADLQEQIMLFYPHAVPHVAAPADLPDWYSREIPWKRTTAFGFWAWKFTLVLQVLQTMNIGDVLLYADGRCSCIGPIKWLDEFMANSSLDLSAIVQPLYLEKTLTRADVMAAFGVTMDDRVAETGQLMAGYFAVRKTAATVQYFQYLVDLVRRNFDLLVPVEGVLPNAPEFVKHQADQSLWSLTLKTGVSGIPLRTNVHHYGVFDSLMYHARPHPDQRV